MHLDYREKGGYDRKKVDFHPKDCHMNSWQLNIYIGTQDNPFFTGPRDDDEIADIISKSVGPSGSNIEYLFKLAEALQEVGITDSHLNSLVLKVKKLIQI